MSVCPVLEVIHSVRERLKNTNEWWLKNANGMNLSVSEWAVAVAVVVAVAVAMAVERDKTTSKLRVSLKVIHYVRERL